MTELQREFELATRAEQRQRELERQRLLKKTPVSSPQRPRLPAALRGCCMLVGCAAALASLCPWLACTAQPPPGPRRPPLRQGDVAEKAEKAAAKAAKRVSGRSKSGREEREEAAKKSAMEELKAARERKARGAEER